MEEEQITIDKQKVLPNIAIYRVSGFLRQPFNFPDFRVVP
jgi:hypothetical protein